MTKSGGGTSFALASPAPNSGGGVCPPVLPVIYAHAKVAQLALFRPIYQPCFEGMILTLRWGYTPKLNHKNREICNWRGYSISVAHQMYANFIIWSRRFSNILWILPWIGSLWSCSGQAISILLNLADHISLLTCPVCFLRTVLKKMRHQI